MAKRMSLLDRVLANIGPSRNLLRDLRARYRVTDKMGPGLVGMQVVDAFHTRTEWQLWSVAILRKKKSCCICTRAMDKGERAYRPVGHQWNRYDRAHVKCIEGQKC